MTPSSAASAQMSQYSSSAPSLCIDPQVRVGREHLVGGSAIGRESASRCCADANAR